MPEKNWKRCERMIAELFGGKRIPITGRQRGDVPDADQDWFSLEIKHRKHIPKQLFDALEQAVAAAAGTNKIPIAVWHKQGTRYTDSIVMIRLEDFLDRLVEDNGKPKTIWKKRMDSKDPELGLPSPEDILEGLK